MPKLTTIGDCFISNWATVLKHRLTSLKRSSLATPVHSDLSRIDCPGGHSRGSSQLKFAWSFGQFLDCIVDDVSVSNEHETEHHRSPNSPEKVQVFEVSFACSEIAFSVS